MKRAALLLVLVAASCSAPAAAPASASPSTTATSAPSTTPSATATATPPASATASDPARYGYVNASAGRIAVRAERSTDVILAIAGEQPAASRDGKRIAFWRTGPSGSNPQELRIVDVPGGAEQRLTSLAAGFAGGAIVWSNDGNGLLYEVHSTDLFPGAGGGPKSSRLESFDLLATQAPGATDSALMLTNGNVFVPLAWDKAGQLATALVTGEGGFGLGYVTWDRRTQPAGASAVKRTQFPWQVVAFTVQASPDATLLLAIDGAANVLRIWPAADITKADQVAPGAARITDAQWRPGVRPDVAWVLDDQNVGVFTNQTSSVGTIYRGQSQVRLLSWRVDGSGLVLNEFGKGVLVVDRATLQVTALPHLGAVIAGAVLLK